MTIVDQSEKNIYTEKENQGTSVNNMIHCDSTDVSKMKRTEQKRMFCIYKYKIYTRHYVLSAESLLT
jgi:hypothetical protein